MTAMKTLDKDLGNYLSREVGKGPPTGECPSAETLSKLMDGILEDRNRDDLLSHLATCSDCYELYNDAISIEAELVDEEAGKNLWQAGKGLLAALIKPSTESPGSPPVYLTWLRGLSRKFYVAIPALATALLVIIWLVKTPSPRDLSNTTASLTRNIDIKELNQLVRQSPANWGLFEEESSARASIFIKTGILTNRLEIALAAKDVEEALSLSRQLLELSRNFKLDATVFDPLHKLQKELASGVIPVNSGQQSDHLKRGFKEEGPRDLFEIGVWLSAAKAAVLSGNQIFFNASHDRLAVFLEVARQERVSPPIIRSLISIQQLTAKTPVTETDLVEIKKLLIAEFP